MKSLFSDIGQDKLDRELNDIINEDREQKQYKAEKFKIEPQMSKGDIRQKKIEGYNSYKYSVKTTFATTHYKVNQSEVSTLQQYKCFEDYLLSHSTTGAAGASDLAGPN